MHCVVHYAVPHVMRHAVLRVMRRTCMASMAKTRRERCPSDMRPMGDVCCFVLKPNCGTWGST